MYIYFKLPNTQWHLSLVTDLQNAESVVFPQGLTDHIVTVTTQPADGETESLEMANDILGAEGEFFSNLHKNKLFGEKVDFELKKKEKGQEMLGSVLECNKQTIHISFVNLYYLFFELALPPLYLQTFPCSKHIM